MQHQSACWTLLLYQRLVPSSSCHTDSACRLLTWDCCLQSVLKGLLKADPAQRLTASKLAQICHARQEAQAPTPEQPNWQYNLSYEVHSGLVGSLRAAQSPSS